MVASLIFLSLFMHLQDFALKRLFRLMLVEVCRHLEAAIVMETPIRNDSVNMGMKIQKISMRLNGYAGTGFYIVIR